MKSFKDSFQDRKFRMGGFQTLVMVLVIVIVVVLNLVVAKLDITFDLSSDKIYSITDETRNLAKGIKDEIKLYYMCQEGKQSTQIEKVVKQYDGLGNIKVISKDPIVYPSFAKQYTDDSIQDNDIIVVDETKNTNKIVTASDMLIQDVDYTTYQTTTTLDAEGQITAALQSVTSEDKTKIVTVSGHGEDGLGSGVQDIFTKSNMETKEIKTASEDIPEDCDILWVNGPKYDITEEEYKKLSTYLQEGGKAILCTNIQGSKMKWYNKLLSDYGTKVQEGYVIDPKLMYSSQIPTSVVPSILSSDITQDIFNGSATVVVPQTNGFTTEEDVRSTLTVTPMLATSDEAYAKTNLNAKSYKKEEGDVAGPFYLATMMEDTYTEKTEGEGRATRIVAYATQTFTDDSLVSSNQYGNRSMLLKSLEYLSGENASTLAIPTRSLDQQHVSLNKQMIVFYTVLLVVIVPLAFVVIGFVIWFRRRKN